MQDLYKNNYNTNFNDKLKPHQKIISVNGITVLLLVIISALILLHDVCDFEISKYIFICIATFICVINDKYDIYCFIAFLVPVSSGIPATYITAIALVLVLFKSIYSFKYLFLGIGCIFLVLFLELFSGIRYKFDIIDYMRFAGVFVFPFLMMIDTDRQYKILKMLKFYIAGFCVAVISLFGQMLNTYSLSDILELGVRFGNTRMLLDENIDIMSVSFNPNSLGLICIQIALISLLLYHKQNRRTYLIFLFIATYLGIMTQSIAFLVTYIISFVFYIIFSCKTIKAVVKTLFLSVFTLGCIIFGTLTFLSEYVARFLLRFEVADISDNRIDIAGYYWNEIAQSIDHFIFGVGIQHYPEKYNFMWAAHNATQEVLIAWGIIGLFIIIVLFIILFHNAHKINPQARYIQYLPMIATLIHLQSGQGFSITSNLLGIMVMYSAIIMKWSDDNLGSK